MKKIKALFLITFLFSLFFENINAEKSNNFKAATIHDDVWIHGVLSEYDRCKI